MALPKEILEAIDYYLDVIPLRQLTRGRSYFERGAVLHMECIEPNVHYDAIVRGTHDYEVSLTYVTGDWLVECSCPMIEDCKHGVAALLQLRAGNGNGISNRRPKRREVKPPPVPQPAKTPLWERLTAHLGRELLQEEANFVRRVQMFYQNAKYRALSESALATLRGEYSYSWDPVELWPEYPRNDFYCWLYLAWEFRKRGWSVPHFMNGITDFSLVEAELRAWEHRKEIERWRAWLKAFRPAAPTSRSHTLEVRLAMHAKEARLQWRDDPEAPYADMKQAQAVELSHRFAEGLLTLAPESLSIWSAVHQPWAYESCWAFKYDNANARPALNRLLRLPLPPDRVVTGDGKPLFRADEPLRFELVPPANGDQHYELKLVGPTGAPPPEIICVLEGHPTLYLTQAGLFKGPPAGALESKTRKLIPAPAIETSEGVGFLTSVGIPLPEHLKNRIRTVSVKVQVTCALKRPYPGSPHEDVAITVTATAKGKEKEVLMDRDWEPVSRFLSGKPGDQRSVLTVFDTSAQRHFPRLLHALGAKWLSSDWRVRMTKKLPAAFAAWLQSIPPEIEVRLDKELATLKDAPVSGTVSLDVSEAGIDWFDLRVALKVTDTTLTDEELKLLLNARGGYVRLGKKGWRRLQFQLTPDEEEQLARLGLGAREFSAEPQRFHALQLTDPAAKKLLPPERVEKIERRVSELKTRVMPPQPADICARLRPYQTEGFHFLAYLASNRFGGVLADDMGLGKTLQALTWLAWLRDSDAHSGNGIGAGGSMNENGAVALVNNGAVHAGNGARALVPSLVVCPKSVMDNWRAEAERFCPTLRVRLWRGKGAEELPAARQQADLVVLNYAQLRSLSPAIANAQWHAAILDEAQYIKNPDSQTAQAARALKASHRLALTGTPIENRLLDLWSILGYAMPGVLGNRAHFLRCFDAKDDPFARKRLAARVRPFLLRRTKAQVAADLPDRIEEDLFCEMEGEQKTLYNAELKRARQILLGLKTHAQLNRERFSILTSLLRLRQVCCHPALVDDRLRNAYSAKVSALEDLLEPLMAEGHKVLVFSQFVTMLDLLRETVKKRDWPFFYLAGDTENRGDLVREFQSSPDGAVFLISLKAGGFGLNLTAASYVVLFDPWWNPAVENQAIDRTHRIGQTSKVIAYRLLIRDSIEQKIRMLQKQKAALVEEVLGEERFSQSLTLEDLRFLFAD